MKIRVWNAYASNNSGSYTLVGWFPNEEVAADVAAALTALVEEHTAWLEEQASSDADYALSPLAAFCRDQGLSWDEGRNRSDDWPAYSDDNRPRVLAVGPQVLVHHEYTASMTPSFGELFYKRGGRVSVEHDHSHDPLLVLIEMWWPFTSDATKRERHAEQRAALVDELTRAPGPLTTLPAGAWPAAWRTDDAVMSTTLNVGAIFPDLVAGTAAIRDVAARHGASLQVSILETHGSATDPLAFLRPSRPPPPTPRFDVVVRKHGGDEGRVREAVMESCDVSEDDAERHLATLPARVARSVDEARAREILYAMQQAGADAELVQNDG